MAGVVTVLVAAGVAAGVPRRLTAQQLNTPARYGTANLQGDFRPDPHTVTVQAGGPDAASGLGAECAGFISNDQPDYKVNYSDPKDYALGIYVVGDVDTTLVVNDPAGRWFCNDDFDDPGGVNPGVVFPRPAAGTYDIWVGAFERDDTGAEVTLAISEVGAPWATEASPGGGDSSRSRDGSQLSASGTGFLVSGTGHVLTNHHVIEGCTRLTFQIRGDVPVDATVLATNEAVDLALLRTPLTAAPARFRGGTAVRLGEDVVVFGFPLLGDLSSGGNLTTGIVSALSGLNDDLSRMQMTAQIQPGNSGGPVMDRSGQIVGVVVETANDEFFRRERGTATQNLNFAIRDALARSFLDTNNVRYETAAGETLAVADIAERAQAFTGLILCYQ